MKFKSAKDRFFLGIVLSSILLINLIFLVPLGLSSSLDLLEILIVLFIDFLITSFLLWIFFDINYSIESECLVVKGGIFRSKILYKDITRITRKPNIWVGYRLISSKDAIEIHYKTGLLGSVIISPEDKEMFINELKKRNSDILVEPTST